jgi:hypothetical protein
MGGNEGPPDTDSVGGRGDAHVGHKTSWYRLDELAKLAVELGLPTRWVDADRLDVTLEEGCVLAFCNLRRENDTLVGFDGTPWHSHGDVQFLTSDTTYVEVDELGILVGLGAGELLVITQLIDGQLHDRWIAHKNERLDLRYVKPGEVLRVLCLPRHPVSAA